MINQSIGYHTPLTAFKMVLNALSLPKQSSSGRSDARISFYKTKMRQKSFFFNGNAMDGQIEQANFK